MARATTRPITEPDGEKFKTQAAMQKHEGREKPAVERKEEAGASGRPAKGVMPHFGGKAAPLYTAKK